MKKFFKELSNLIHVLAITIRFLFESNQREGEMVRKSIVRRLKALRAKAILANLYIIYTTKNTHRLPSTFIAEIILPRKDAEFIIGELEQLYKDRFLPRHGQTLGKVIFHIEVLKAAFSCRWEGVRKFLLDWRHKPTRK
jgi:hypothetical protein